MQNRPPDQRHFYNDSGHNSGCNLIKKPILSDSHTMLMGKRIPESMSESLSESRRELPVLGVKGLLTVKILLKPLRRLRTVINGKLLLMLISFFGSLSRTCTRLF
jgi:hypothetical protein